MELFSIRIQRTFQLVSTAQIMFAICNPAILNALLGDIQTTEW